MEKPLQPKPTVLAGPALPPPSQSVDELARELKRNPFFMTDPDDAEDGEENVELEAIKALMLEGCRSENAEDFRDQGNEAARARGWKEAKDFYTKALTTLRAPRKPEELHEFKGEGGKAREAEEDAKELDLRVKCLVNRALCHLELRTLLTMPSRELCHV